MSEHPVEMTNTVPKITTPRYPEWQVTTANRITLRDFFAGCAMMAHIQQESREDPVKLAWRDADAMLAERDKHKEPMP